MADKRAEEIRKTVKERYGEIAATEGSCGCSPSASCCGGPEISSEAIGSGLGYSAADMAQVPSGSNLGLGCGNPLAVASLKPGETVLDLGSGAGFDCFLAARAVGETGSVIGVDMTEEIVSKARKNAEKAGVRNVDFRRGEIEKLPVADSSVDVIMSNCVINLSPEKRQVFQEAFRVLKPGGRLAVSDVVATGDLPVSIQEDMDLVCACIGGAAAVEEVSKMLTEIGFEQVRIDVSEKSREMVAQWAPGIGAEKVLASAYIEAVKPL